MLKKGQNGVTMLETLISLVVISVGVLGAVKLQVFALSETNHSFMQSQAVWLVNEMTDRIKANKQSFYAYAGVDTLNGSYSVQCDNGLACTSNEMVQHDAREWSLEVADLTLGVGRIMSTANGGLRVLISWDADGDDVASSNVNETFSVEIRL